jgi:hypothetical protein
MIPILLLLIRMLLDRNTAFLLAVQRALGPLSP